MCPPGFAPEGKSIFHQVQRVRAKPVNGGEQSQTHKYLDRQDLAVDTAVLKWKKIENYVYIFKWHK